MFSLSFRSSSDKSVGMSMDFLVCCRSLVRVRANEHIGETSSCQLTKPSTGETHLPAFSRLAAVIVHNCDLNLPVSCSSTVKRSSHFRKNSAWTSVRCPAFSSYSSMISSSSMTGTRSTVYHQLSSLKWNVLFDIAYNYRRHNTSCIPSHYRS
jgi:hypothetical protein